MTITLTKKQMEEIKAKFPLSIGDIILNTPICIAMSVLCYVKEHYPESITEIEKKGLELKVLEENE